MKIFNTKTEQLLTALILSAVVAGGVGNEVHATSYVEASVMTVSESTTGCVIKMQTNDPNTGEPLQGGSYRITKTTGEFIGTYTADATGTVLSSPLDAGTYLVKQIIAPDGYLLSTNTVTINTTGYPEDSLISAQFWCEKMAGLVIQNVVQENYDPLAGCVFAVYNESGTQIFAGTTSVTGVLETGIVAPGLYTVKQLTTMEGYSITQATRTVEVKIDEATTTIFENTSLTNLRILLIDSDTRLGISDAVFKVEDGNGAIVATVITDSDGTALIPNLPIGSYFVKQFTAASGYILEGDYQSVTMQAGMDKELTFQNALATGIVIRAVCVDGYTPVSGAVYEIFNGNGKLVTTLTSDSTGVMSTGTLEPGSYLVKQILTPEGYACTNVTQTVVVAAEDPTTVTFLHQETANLIISVKDAVTGDLVADVLYQIRTATGEYVGDYVTNDSGLITVPYLAAGTYSLVQMGTPTGYIQDSTALTFTIENDVTVKLDLKVNKQAHVILTNMDRATGAPIRDSVFKILDMNGQLIGMYTTDELGQISVSLVAGSYTAIQVSASSIFELNATPINFEINENENVQISLYNEMYTRLTVKVVDSTSKMGIYNVDVELKDSLNNSLGRYKTDNEGYIYFEDTIPEGRYTLTLISVPSTYNMDNIPRTLTMEHGKTTDYIFELGERLGQVCISTYAGEDSSDMNIWKGTLISGGTYNIISQAGEIVMTIQGDSLGKAYTGALPYGTYYIDQVTAPVGFMVNNTRVTVNISASNETVKLDMYNKASQYLMTVSVKGTQNTEAGSTNKHFFTDIKASSTNPMENFFFNINIPAQYVEASSIYTGTWNTNTVYYLEYKTNLNDYRILASSLSSKSQYSYDLDPVSLALGTGEYVTDVRFVFPSISSGFHEEMTPTLYTTVRNTTTHGTNYTIRGELGGMIDGAWYVGSGEFTSTATNNFVGNTTYYPSIYPTITFPTSLPQTGY